MSANQVMVAVNDTSKITYYYYITISSGVCTVIETQTGATLNASHLALATISATRALLVSAGTSGYGNASELGHAL